MKEKVYELTIGYRIMKDGNEVDYHTEKEYYKTYLEAVKALEKHHKGEQEAYYSDGAIVVCDGAELDEEPKEIEFC